MATKNLAALTLSLSLSHGLLHSQIHMHALTLPLTHTCIHTHTHSKKQAQARWAKTEVESDKGMEEKKRPYELLCNSNNNINGNSSNNSNGNSSNNSNGNSSNLKPSSFIALTRPRHIKSCSTLLQVFPKPNSILNEIFQGSFGVTIKQKIDINLKTFERTTLKKKLFSDRFIFFSLESKKLVFRCRTRARYFFLFPDNDRFNGSR